MLITAAAQAQVVSDPRAPIQFQPRVGAAPNGTPVIDVTKPSFGGLSHNKYERYNVDTRGVILNNSGLGGTSILGGQIWGNPNLQNSRPASVILNEVTGSSSSLLNGPTEVFGSRADVIVANPNGVTCASCSFINTGRVTLSSGVPVPDYDRGTVSFSTTRGKVTIEGSGVAAYNADGTAAQLGDLDLVGRQIEVNGPINAAGAVRLRAGAVLWNQTSDTASTIAGASPVTGPGIVSGADGAIQAGTISAVSYDLNVGVQFNGDLTALGIETPDGRGGVTRLSGLVAVTSAGDLSVASAGSTGDLRYEAAGGLSLTGTQQAMGRLTGSGDTISVGAVAVIANDAIVLEAVRDLTSNGALQAGTDISTVAGGNLTASGSMAAVGQIDVEGANVAANKFQAAGSSVNIAGLYNVGLEETVLAGSDWVSVLGQDVRLGVGTGFQSDGPIYVDARGTLTNATTLNYPNLTLDLGRALVNEATGQIVADNLVLTLSDRIINAGLLYGRLSTVIDTGTLTNAAGGIVYGAEVTVSVSQNLINAGAEPSGEAGRILSEGKLTVTALGALANDGAIQADGDIVLKAASYTANSAQAILAGAKADLIVAGAFDNAGTVQGTDRVALSAASLDNRAGAVVYGNGVSLTLTGALTNAGQILSVDTLSIAAGDIRSSGDIQANGAVTVKAASYDGEAGSHLIGANVTANLTGALSNAGVIYGSAVDLTVQGDVVNTGDILSEGDLTLSGAGLNNTGAIQANGAVGLTVASYTGGASAKVSGSDVSLAASGAIDNAGTILADNALVIGGQSLINRSGGRFGGYDVALTIGGDIDNAGRIEAQNLLTLSGVNLANSGAITALEMSRADPADSTTLVAGISLSGHLANSGTIQTTNNLLIAAGSLDNAAGATLQARALALSMPGALTNHGVIASDTLLLIEASDLTNSGTSASDAILSGGQVQITLANALTNGPHSLLQGTDSTVISANTANLDLFQANDLAQGQFNYGKNLALTLRNQGLDIAAGQSLIVDGSLYLNYGGDVTVFGTLASRGDLSLASGGTIAIGNTDPSAFGGAIVYTLGNAELTASGDIRNHSSVIESAGDMSLTAGGTVLNTRGGTATRFDRDEIFVNGSTWLYKYYEEYELTPASVINAGGNLTINANAVTNMASTISSGGDLRINADTIENLTRELKHYRDVYKIGCAGSGGCDKGYRYSEAVASTETASLFYASGALVLRGGTAVTGTGTIQAQQVAILAPTITLGITDPNRAMAAPRLPDPVIDLTSYFNIPGQGGVNGRNGGFSGPAGNPVTIGNITYLHAAPIPGGSNERGPGWILEQVGDVRSNLTFFADPATERRAIQQAILEQTGRAYLDPRYRNPAEQQEALYQATANFLEAHPDIHLGDVLTDAQRASLTEPILWYVAQTIDGQTVLVPQLILPESRLADWTRTYGGTVAANDIYLSGSTVYNSGALLANDTLSISADTFTNERRSATLQDRPGRHIEIVQDGGVLAGNVVQIVTTGNLTNIGGTVIADKALNLVAGGDLVLTSTVVHSEIHERGRKYGIDSSTTTNYGGTVYSGGDAALYAGHDLTVAGSSVIALGNTSLLAGNDLSITSVTDESHVTQTSKSSSAWRTKRTTATSDTTTEVSSNIVAGGNLTVAAGGNVDIHASNLVSGNDMLVAAGAGANGRKDASVTITAGQNTNSQSYSQTRTGIGVGSGNGWVNIKGQKKVTSSTDTAENAASTLAAGGNLTISAPQDIAIQGSVVSAGGTAALSAGRDINVTPGENDYGSSYSRTITGEGFGDRSHGGGTIKAQAGFRRDKIEGHLDTATVVPSVIQGGAGVSLNAGHDINLQAAVVTSPGDITISAGHDVNMTTAYNTSSETFRHDQLFIGVTAQASQNVTGIINGMKQAAHIFNSGHGGAAYQAVGVISGVMKALDTIAAASNGPRVSASITAGGEGKKHSEYKDSLIAQGTELDAGGNLTITAGNDIHMTAVQGHASGDINLSAGHDLIIESGQSYAASGTKDSSWNVGVGFGASAGLGGAAAGIQIQGGFSQADYDSTATEQVNSHLSADGAVNMRSGHDTTIAGAVIHGSEVNLDVGNNLTIQSRQDLGHAEGSSVQAGGSLTIGYGVAVSVYGGGGSSKSDVAWVREQTGIYSDDGLNIRVGNHTQVDGAVINSSTGNLTLDTGTLGFSTIKDHDTGSAFSMVVSASYSTLQDTPYPWNTVRNTHNSSNGGSGTGKNQGSNDPKTGLPAGGQVSGSIEKHDRQQDTNATIGAGTITIRDQNGQKQDAGTLNRDLGQAQVLTKNESAGVQFYGSSSAAVSLSNPVLFTQQTLNGFERQFDQLAALGNDGAARLREAARNGTITKDTIDYLRRCASRGQSGFNLLNLFTTSAYASDLCYLPLGDHTTIAIQTDDVKKCDEVVQDYLAKNRDRIYLEHRNVLTVAYAAAVGPDLYDPGKAEEAEYKSRSGIGSYDIRNGRTEAAYYYSDDGNKVYVTNDSGQRLYANSNTGEVQWYDPTQKNTVVGHVEAPVGPDNIPYDGAPNVGTPVYGSDPLDQKLARENAAAGFYILTLGAEIPAAVQTARGIGTAFIGGDGVVVTRAVGEAAPAETVVATRAGAAGADTTIPYSTTGTGTLPGSQWGSWGGRATVSINGSAAAETVGVEASTATIQVADHAGPAVDATIPYSTTRAATFQQNQWGYTTGNIPVGASIADTTIPYSTTGTGTFAESQWSARTTLVTDGAIAPVTAEGTANTVTRVQLANDLHAAQAYDARVGTTLPGANNPVVVTAESDIGGRTFFDTNQGARPTVLADPNKPTLISDLVSPGNPNGNMATAHAEVGLIQQAHDAGLTQGQSMSIIVRGNKSVCDYCMTDVLAAADRAGLDRLQVIDTKGERTLTWTRGSSGWTKLQW